MAEFANEYEIYSAPDILSTASFLVDFPRRDYSTDFDLLVAGNEDDREAYKSGLLVLGCILASIYVIWWMVILVLKCKGKSVGCASGRSFRGERVLPENRVDGSGSTDVEDEWASGAGPSRGERGFGDEMSFQSSIKSSEIEENEMSDGESRSDSVATSIPTARERRTQIAFFVFGLITLATVPLVLTLSFSPLKRAIDSSEGYILQSRAILSQVDNALNTITIAVDTAARVVTDVPSTASQLCPRRTFDEIEEAYGVNLEYVASVITLEYERIRASIDTRLEDVISNKNDFEEVLQTLETAQKETETYLWAIPGLMLGLTSVTAALLFGVLLAWKRQSNRQAQRTLSYGVLPCLICISLVCWLIGISSALSVALFGDACTQGQRNGSPDRVVESIVQLRGYEQNTTTFKIVKAFTSGCNAEINPTIYIEAVEEEVQQIIDDIWGYILRIDSVGREDLMSICGSDSLTDMINEAQDIARLLTSVRRALAAVSSSLQCEEIYPVYSGTVEDSVCTDLATSSSWAMFMFLLLGVTTMCMISLRASWRHKVGEDQIYNEDEVAENMFLDEHEEYLHYISKYKHEWEEYGGINSVVPMTPGPRQSLYDQTSQSEETTGSRTSLGEEPGNCAEVDEIAESEQMKYITSYTGQQEAFNPYQGTTPVSPSTEGSEDISFLSLRTLQTRTPQSKGEESDCDIEIASNEGPQSKVSHGMRSSALGLLKEAVDQYSAIFQDEEKRGRRVDKEADVGHSVMGPVSTTNPRLAHSSSDVGREDSDLVSLTRLRSTTSEGGGYFKKNWRTRTSVSHLSGDLQQIRDDLMPKSASQTCISLHELNPSSSEVQSPTKPKRSQSEYSL